ncbi:YhgE/Pip domain-containing protein [Coriobacteriia bacterium Es71-Z0120]|uniref:YhgE/Pip domain-containing protein n=1 Tax=Parvivirga hydrogeniphila TaxID=2939460 RepID=UPI002260A8AF|nr:YhgE/Pip domain-containing protein [Parvivirga hydrogeniphila]MCL4078068.1 YhgE/Pip domain-containing protein [Parvivirga hydrogeniphila]
MQSLAIARAEVKRALTDRKVRLATLVIALVPLLYGALYLWAFWDPYDRLDSLPVALVNLDRPARADDRVISAGNDLVRELLKRKTFDWHVVSAEEAHEGLADGRYYLSLTIPGDFSERLASVEGSESSPATLTVQAHESANLLAAQIGDRVFQEVRASASASASRSYLEQIFVAFSDVKDGLDDAASGARRLSDGLVEATDGARKLASGADSARKGAERLHGGLAALADGTDKLARGAGELSQALAQLEAGARQVDAGAQALRDGTAALSAGVEQATGQLAPAIDGAKQVSQGAAGTVALLQAYAETHPDAASDPAFAQALGTAKATSAGAASLAEGLGQAATQIPALAAGAHDLASGASDLAAGTSALAAGMDKAASAAAALDAGAVKLAGGSGAAASGARDLTAGLSRLSAGTHSLASGLTPAVDGSAELADRLADGASEMPAYDERSREEKATLMADPVRLETERIDPVPNYGTGFSPYFIPLALWVGALMAFFVAHPLPARAIEERRNPLVAALAGFWPAALMGVAQTTVMLAVLRGALGLHPRHVVALYAFAVLSSLTFLAIIQWLSAAFGPVGKFASIVLLMLQLTSSAGTFPLEVVPPFFQAINPYLPMTYVVAGLRQAISDADASALAANARMLGVFLVLGLLLTAITAWRARSWDAERLHPALEL